jgi:drug/metabolite transporter (DMT)-like permease
MAQLLSGFRMSVTRLRVEMTRRARAQVTAGAGRYADVSVASDGLALLASGLWGTSDFLGGSLSRRMRALHVLSGSQAVAAVLVVAATAVLGVGDVTGDWPGWAIAAGVTWALGMAAFYTALAVGTMGVVAPIASAGAVVPVGVGLLEGERPGYAAVVGVAAALLGVAAAAGPDVSDRTGRRAAVGLAILTAVLFGIEICCLAQGSRASAPLTLVGMRLSALACTWLALAPLGRPFGAAGRRRPRHRARARRPQGRDVVALLTLGVLDCAATAAYAWAARGGLVSLVAVLASLYPAVTVLLARRVHDERLTRVQWAGILGVLAGAACIGCSGA